MEMTLDELKNMVAGVIEDRLKTLSVTDLKHGALPGVSQDQIDHATYIEKFSTFLKGLVKGETQVCRETEQSWLTQRQKALSEGVDTAGGYLVPEEFRAEIIRLIPKFGLLRRFARTMPMAHEVLRVPRQTAGVSVTWPGEKAKGTSKQPTLGQVVLTAKTAVGLTSYSNEFLADAGISVIAYLQTIFAEAFAEEEDDQLFNGTGAPFTGLLVVSGTKSLQMASGKTAITDITIDNLIDLADKVDPEADVDAWYYFHKSALTALRKVKVSSSYALAPASQGAPATIAGVPYATSKKLPNAPAVDTNFAVYGNLRNVLLGDREAMTIGIAKEGTIGSDNLFEQNMQGLRITERISIESAIPSAFAILKTAAS